MRTTVTVDDELMGKASQLTGRNETSALVRLDLEALVERESAKRLAALGGTDPGRKQCSPPTGRLSVILVDASVWIDHLHRSDPVLVDLLGRWWVVGGAPSDGGR